MVVDTTLLSVGPIFLNDLSFDPKKDFVPIAALARSHCSAGQRPDADQDADDFVAYVWRIPASSTTAPRVSAAPIS